MSRFFVEEKNIKGNTIVIDDPQDVKHLTRVLRHRVGDLIEISDGKSFEYEIELEALSDQMAEGRILSKREFTREPRVQVTLYQSIPKQSRMETIVQKGVELGVAGVVPMISERTIVLDKGNHFVKKVQRWQAVSDEAVKQCRRGIIPKVSMPISLEQVLSEMKENDLNLFFFEEERNQSVKEVLRRVSRDAVKTVGILIGPEGGFSEREAERITEAGALSVSMGKTVLRVETAAVAALAMVMYELEL